MLRVRIPSANPIEEFARYQGSASWVGYKADWLKSRR